MDIFQPRKHSVDLNLERDYISNMPPNVKEEVLMKLPIKEAVRTCILSTKWKYAWMSIPNLVFTEDCAQSELIRLVDQVLLVHHGPILQFKLISGHACNEAIGRWMLILSRNGIKNLHIKLGHFNNKFMIPSSFFSCLALEHVHIVCGNINVPPSFPSFKFLRTLRLFKFDFDSGIFVSKLISSCPLLEILELSDIYILEADFIIRAPNLRWLSITGDYVDLCLETPKLLFAKIYCTPCIDIEQQQYVKQALGNLSAIEELQLCSNFLMFFADDEECKPEVPFYQLTELHIDFHDIHAREVAIAFCLFESAPNLKVLSLRLPDEEEMEVEVFEDQHYPSSLAQLFWEMKGIELKLFNCLQIVKITYFVDHPKTILKFAKFILRTAPVLEKLIVREMNFRRERRSFLKKLASFPRLSNIAKILFVE